MTAPSSVTVRTPAAAASVVLVGGHESAAARDLAPWAGSGAGDTYTVVPAGAPLTQAVARLLAERDAPVCVIPMTLGRDRALVAEAARSLRWAQEGGGSGRTVLSAPFGTQDHLVGWLRAAAGRGAGDATAVLVTAPAADPFADAELFRVARLVRQYGGHRWVEVAFTDGDPDVPQGVERCRRLGAEDVLLLSAGFGPPATSSPPVAGAVDGGPLLSRAAVEGVVAARRTEALHRLAHGDDGVAAGLDAEHGHGFAHTHADISAPSAPGAHTHSHPHAHLPH
ncbi:sirohydrochlorin chelatase [Streptomyces sp. NPDC008079]|uniref:sirohydrochlorin chelatase n=1 Tax=Streptomyces sp. NPDC008079 TaxID=3364806 RepID=UPI0036E8719C